MSETTTGVDNEKSILGIPVPVFGATGPKYSGKTLLGASLAPGNHPEGHEHAGKERTLIIDLEASSTTYSLPAKRIDGPAMLREKHGDKQYTQLDMFVWFRELMATVPVGRFDVIMVDPISDIEAGGVAYVKANPVEFGYTAEQFNRMTGIMIDCAKKFWKSICLDMATRCQIFYFATHEKLRWEGSRPTKDRVPKGMDYLFECASLYLHLDREKDVEGEPPKPPSAEVLKSRLAFTSIDKVGELAITEILPKRLPIATKAAIQKYVKHPIGKRKAGLKPEEIVQDKELSDDERLLIQQEIASAQAESANAKLSALELAKAAAEAGAVHTVTATVTESSQPVAESLPQTKMASESQQNEMLRLMRELFVTGEDAGRWLQQQEGNTNHPSLLTDPQADGVLSKLNLMKHEKDTAELPPQPAAEGMAIPEAAGIATSQPEPDRASQDQRDKIKELTVQLYGDDALKQNTLYLQKLGYGSANSLTDNQAISRIAQLKMLLNPKPTPEPEDNF